MQILFPAENWTVPASTSRHDTDSVDAHVTDFIAAGARRVGDLEAVTGLSRPYIVEIVHRLIRSGHAGLDLRTGLLSSRAVGVRAASPAATIEQIGLGYWPLLGLLVPHHLRLRSPETYPEARSFHAPDRQPTRLEDVSDEEIAIALRRACQRDGRRLHDFDRQGGTRTTGWVLANVVVWEDSADDDAVASASIEFEGFATAAERILHEELMVSTRPRARAYWADARTALDREFRWPDLYERLEDPTLSVHEILQAIEETVQETAGVNVFVGANAPRDVVVDLLRTRTGPVVITAPFLTSAGVDKVGEAVRASTCPVVAVHGMANSPAELSSDHLDAARSLRRLGVVIDPLRPANTHAKALVAADVVAVSTCNFLSSGDWWEATAVANNPSVGADVAMELLARSPDTATARIWLDGRAPSEAPFRFPDSTADAPTLADAIAATRPLAGIENRVASWIRGVRSWEREFRYREQSSDYDVVIEWAQQIAEILEDEGQNRVRLVRASEHRDLIHAMCAQAESSLIVTSHRCDWSAIGDTAKWLAGAGGSLPVLTASHAVSGEPPGGIRHLEARLHAKIAVMDERWTLVTSFELLNRDAAQRSARQEIGLLIDGESQARKLRVALADLADANGDPEWADLARN